MYVDRGHPPIQSRSMVQGIVAYDGHRNRSNTLLKLFKNQSQLRRYFDPISRLPSAHANVSSKNADSLLGQAPRKLSRPATKFRWMDCRW